jgi:hypothetical protein
MIDYTKDEYKAFQEGIKDYCYKHHRYKHYIDFKDFEESMRGIYTTSVAPSTIDESPFVYKPMNEIIKNIKETVDIVSCIKPVYNYKAKDDINYVKNKEDIDLSL